MKKIGTAVCRICLIILLIVLNGVGLAAADSLTTREPSAPTGTTDNLEAGRSASPGLLIGNTYYDRQQLGSAGRAIATNGGACGLLVHSAFVLQAAPAATAQIGYSVYDCSAGLLSGHQIGSFVESALLDVPYSGAAVLGGHMLYSTAIGLLMYDACCGCGSFGTPIQMNNCEWPRIRYQETGTGPVTHVLTVSSVTLADGGQQLFYFRKVGSSYSGTWDTPFIVDTVYNYGYDLAASHLSGSVALVWMAPLTGASDKARDNDICYRKSFDAGATWGSQVNLTNNVDGIAGFRPGNDLSALHDAYDVLHIVWSDRVWPADANSGGTIGDNCRIAHWSDAYPFITTVHSADWHQTVCNGGVGTMNVAKPSLAVCYDKLYTIFVQFNNIPAGIEDDCASRAWTGDPDGAANGELYLCVSADGGASWDAARDLTNSYSPQCDDSPGSTDRCQSDNWPSISPYGSSTSCSNPVGVVVVDPSSGYTGEYYLDVRYIDDASPGSYLDGEGTQVQAGVRWFRLPCVEPGPVICELSLVRPQAGETFYDGGHYLVLWDRGGTTGPVDIQLSTDNGGTWSTVAGGLIGSSWTWSVSQATTTYEALLRVVVQSDPTCTAQTISAFTIMGHAAPVELECQLEMSGHTQELAQAAKTKVVILPATPSKAARSAGAAPFEEDHPEAVLFSSGDILIGYFLDEYAGTCYYEPVDEINVGTDASDFAVADFNNDGIDDIVVVSWEAFEVRVYLGWGDYTFHDEPIVSPGPGPWDIAEPIVDENGDGNLDLLVESYPFQELSWLYGNGDGTFEPAPTNPFGGTDCPCMASLAYFDDDPYIDIAAYAYGGQVVVFFGDGNGGFTDYWHTVAGMGGYPPDVLTVADRNHDGRIDLGIGGRAFDASFWKAYLNQGDRTFAPQTIFQNGPPGVIVGTVISDFSGDGINDLVLVQRDSLPRVRFFPGVFYDTLPKSADGLNMLYAGDAEALDSLLLFGYPVSIPTVENPIDVGLRDYNLDGIPDLVVLSETTREIWYYPGVDSSRQSTSLTLISPNGGEQLEPESTCVISFSKGEGITAVDLYLSRNMGATWQRIATNLPGSSFAWRVTGPGTDQCLIKVVDAMSYTRSDQSNAVFSITCCRLRGDFDGSGQINVSDLTALVSFLFQGGLPAACATHADVDHSGGVNVADLTFMVAYLFSGGPPPAGC